MGVMKVVFRLLDDVVGDGVPLVLHLLDRTDPLPQVVELLEELLEPFRPLDDVLRRLPEEDEELLVLRNDPEHHPSPPSGPAPPRPRHQLLQDLPHGLDLLDERHALPRHQRPVLHVPLHHGAPQRPHPELLELDLGLLARHLARLHTMFSSES